MDGEAVFTHVPSAPGKPLSIGRALRVAIAMYRSRGQVQKRLGFREYDRAIPVPEIFQVRCLETDELFDPGACNNHTATESKIQTDLPSVRRLTQRTLLECGDPAGPSDGDRVGLGMITPGINGAYSAKVLAIVILVRVIDPPIRPPPSSGCVESVCALRLATNTRAGRRTRRHPGGLPLQGLDCQSAGLENVSGSGFAPALAARVAAGMATSRSQSKGRSKPGPSQKHSVLPIGTPARTSHSTSAIRNSKASSFARRYGAARMRSRRASWQQFRRVPKSVQ
jgi:hypothetical protein